MTIITEKLLVPGPTLGTSHSLVYLIFTTTHCTDANHEVSRLKLAAEEHTRFEPSMPDLRIW